MVSNSYVKGATRLDILLGCFAWHQSHSGWPISNIALLWKHTVDWWWHYDGGGVSRLLLYILQRMCSTVSGISLLTNQVEHAWVANGGVSGAGSLWKFVLCLAWSQDTDSPILSTNFVLVKVIIFQGQKKGLKQSHKWYIQKPFAYWYGPAQCLL